MNIKLKKLHLNNFLSFEDEELSLCDNGYTLVNGVNENPDDLARSNGSGKSSIWEAISWVLTGETIRGTKEVKRLGSETECSVELLFDVDKDEYRVIRTKEPSNLKVYINGEDKSGKGIRDTEKLLEEYLPDLTSSLIGSVIILGQGLPQRFTNNTPSGRKEVLEKLSKSDFMIDDLKRRVSERKTKLEQDVRSTEDAILSLDTEVATLNSQIEKAEKELSELKDVESYKSILDIEQVKLRDTKTSKDLLDIEIDSVNKNIAQLKDALNELKVSKQTEIANIEQKYYSNTNTLVSDKSNAEALKNGLESEIAKLESINDICPTCGQKLPGVFKPDTSEQKAKLEEVKVELEKLKLELSLKEEEKLSSINKVNSRNIVKESELNSKLIELNSKLLDNKQLMINLDDSVKKHEEMINDAKMHISNYETAVATYNKNIKDFKEKVIEDTSKKENVLKLLDESNEHLNVISKMFTAVSRDFRGYLLTNVIGFINSKAKEYSKDVFDTDKINFVVDGNNISISYDGKEYENLSGGEKQKVDLIVQLAIRDMLCTYLDFSCNILVVDELFDNLDDIGCQRILNLISTKIVDVDSIYVVTHHSDISIPTDNEIIVVKGADKISRIRR